VCTKGHKLYCLRHVMYYPSNLGHVGTRASNKDPIAQSLLEIKSTTNGTYH